MVCNVVLVVAPAVDYGIGSPYAVVRSTLDLDSEHSLPAWYASIQWFIASALFGSFVILLRRGWRSAMTALALVCLAFSADEIVGFHEWLGQRTDALLPGGDRANTVLWRTGIWPLIIGVPVVLLLGGMLVQVRRMYAPAPRAFRLLVLGFALMFGGALLVELGANLVVDPDDNQGLALLQLICEELLEMLGVTLIIWSAYALLVAYGCELRLSPAVARATARSASPARKPATTQPATTRKVETSGHARRRGETYARRRTRQKTPEGMAQPAHRGETADELDRAADVMRRPVTGEDP